MSKLTRFFGTCLLIASISAAAFADGGATQGPPAPTPPPSGQYVPDGTPVEPAIQPAQNSSVDLVTAVDMLADWLVVAIL